jgi:hypothetical protein
MDPEAIAEWQKAMTLDGDTQLAGVLRQVYSRVGYMSTLQAWVDELKKRSQHRYVSPYSVAGIYALLESKDGVFEYLEKAYQDRAAELVDLKSDPVFDFVHLDPRYVALIRKMNFPQSAPE